ncbi:MAG: uracil phosphoribosyltransferase [Aquificaceae bacterium]
MPLRILSAPLLRHKLNLLRDKNTPPEILRSMVEDLTLMAMPYIAEEFPVKEGRVKTPMGEDSFKFIKEESLLFVCILRAGIPMLNASLRAFPRAKAGFLAIRRDEKNLKPKLYYKRLPELKNKWVIILDPMLATGGSLSMAVEEVKPQKPDRILSFNLVASPQGLERLVSLHPEVEFFVISVDKELNQKGYIVPGVGDIGDRLFTEYPSYTL